MKQFYGSVFSVIVILAVSVNPVFAPHVSFRYCETCGIAPHVSFQYSETCGVAASKNNISAQKTVTASAVVVPAQVSELGFLISGIAKEIPVREGDSVKAGQTLLVLDTPDLQFAVTEAEAGLRAAQAEAEIRRNEIIKKIQISYRRNGFVSIKKLRLSVPHEVLEIADANIQQAQASVEIAQANLAQGTLSAPHDGTIAAIKVIPGEFVPSDQAVLTLATLNTLQIETTDLSEHDIPNVQIGDSANIFVEALNQNISGKVIGIAPIASTVGGDVVFKVTIAPDTQPEGLRWGMTAEVEIKSGE